MTSSTFTPSLVGRISTHRPFASTLHSNSFHHALYSGQSIHFPDGNIPKLQPAIIADGLLRMILLLILQSSGALSIFQFVLYDVPICLLMILYRRCKERLCRVSSRPVPVSVIVLIDPWSRTTSTLCRISARPKLNIRSVRSICPYVSSFSPRINPVRNAVSKVARVYRAKVFGISLTLLSAPLKAAKNGLVERRQNGF